MDVTFGRRQALRILGTIPFISSLEGISIQSEDNSQSWPKLGYDKANTGYAPDNTGPTTGLAKNLLSLTPSSFLPVSVVDGIAYYGSGWPPENPGTVYAIDVNSGTEEWSFETEEGLTTQATVEGTTLYIGTQGTESDPGIVYAVDAETGDKNWEFELDAHTITSAPAVSSNMVFIPGGTADVIAVDRETGTEQWRSEVISPGTPAIVDDSLYVSGIRLHKFTLDGTKEWETPGQPDFDFQHSSPAVANGTVYNGGVDGYLSAIDGETGDEIWRYSTESDDRVNAVPAVANGRVFFSCTNGNVYGLDAETGEELWVLETDSTFSRAAPAIVDGVVYVGNVDSSLTGTLYGLDPASGEIIFEHDTEYDASQPLAVLNETVYMTTAEGLCAFEESGDGSGESAFFEVTISDPSDGEQVTEDEPLEVTVDVSNTGEESDTQQIKLVNPVERTESGIELAADENTTVNFTIPASDVNGNFEIVVESEDDSGSTSVSAVDPCFIATAAYDTPTAREIDVLRDFRDDILDTNPLGRVLIQVYYRVSPPIANWVRRSPRRRKVVRKYFVSPLVQAARSIRRQ